MGVNIPVGFGSAAIEITGSKGTSPYVTTIGVDLSDAGGDFVGAANSILICFQNNFTDRMDEELTVTRCILAVGQDGESASVVSTAAAEDGTVGTASEAIAMAPCIYKLTSTLGRRGRGKSMIPGILRETEVGSFGTIDSGARSNILSRYQSFLDDLPLTAGGQVPTLPVLLHSGSTGTSPSPIVGAAVRDKVAWVRGRLF